MKSKLVAGLFISAILFIGCSGNSPVVPVSPDASDGSFTSHPQKIAGNNRYTLGFWLVDVDENREFSVRPVRGINFHINAVKMLEAGLCTDCLEISNVVVEGPSGISFDLTITHPLAETALDFTAFDLRAIFITQGDYTFPVNGRITSWDGTNPALLNPDGYTHLFNPTEFPESSPLPPVLKYYKGKFAHDDLFSANLNGFIAFSKDQPRRMFLPGSEQVEKVHVHVPPVGFRFGYAVDLSWVDPPGTVTDPENDFPPGANCHEAYEITASLSENPVTWPGSQVEISVGVYDHQGADGVLGVEIEAPDIFEGVSSLELVSDLPLNGALYTGFIQNDLAEVIGTYPLLIVATNSSLDPNLGQVDAWQLHHVTVEQHEKVPPVAIAAADEYVCPAGFEIEFFNDGSFDPDGGQVEYFEWDWDYDGTYDDSGSTVLHTWSTPGIYQVGMRATDDEGQMDEIDVPLEINIIDGVIFNPVDVTPDWLLFTAQDVCSNGDYAYVACGENGLHIVDVTDKSTPVWVSKVDTGDVANEIGIDNGVLYVSTISEFRIYSLDSPGNPVQAGSVTTLSEYGEFGRFVIKDGFAYILDYNESRLVVADVDPPGSATVTQSFSNLENLADIFLDGNLIYILYGSGNLAVFDVSNPDLIELPELVYTDYYGEDLIVHDGYAFIRHYNNTNILDIDPLSETHYVNYIGDAYQSCRIEIVDDYLYMTFRQIYNRVAIYDITDPENPQSLPASDQTGMSDGMFLDGNYLYTVMRESDLHILDVTSPGVPVRVGSYDTIGDCINLAVTNGYLYAGDALAGLRVIDINPPESAQIIYSSGLQLMPREIDVHGNRLYVGNTYPDCSLVVLDISNPSSPAILGEIVLEKTGFHYEDIHYSNGIVYVLQKKSSAPGSGEFMVQVIDVESPENLQIVAEVTFDTVNYGGEIAVKDDYIYVTDHENGLTVLRMDLPDSIIEVTSLDTSGIASGLDIAGDYAFVTNRDTGEVFAIDIGDPENPGIISSYQSGLWSNNVVDYKYGHAFVYCYGLDIIDFADIYDPSLAASTAGIGGVYEIVVKGGTAFMCRKKIRFFRLWD